MPEKTYLCEKLYAMNVFCRMIVTCLLGLLPQILAAQAEGTVWGRVVCASVQADGDTLREALPYATVQVVSGKDTVQLAGTLTGRNGDFRLRFRKGSGEDCLLKASFTGMSTAYIPLDRMSREGEVWQAGEIVLHEGIELAEVTVTAQRRDIVQSGDTTVINVEAFAAPEGSYLEELVSRIPGLEYDPQEKTLTYEGKSIGEINLNGETFFGGDMTMALENLQADLIDQIKVYDKQTKQEELTGMDDGQRNYVLDLQTKPEVSGNLMLTGEVGQGNHRKRDYRMQTHHFLTNGNNFSLVGSTGNRTMNSDYRGNVRHSLGTSFSQKLNDKLQLNGNVNYSRFKSGNQSASYNEQYLTAANQYSHSTSESVSDNRSLYAQLGANWQPDKRTLLYLNGSFSLNRSGNGSESRNATFSQPTGLDVARPFDGPDLPTDSIGINQNRRQNSSSSHRRSYSVSLTASRVLNEHGTSLNLNLRHSAGDGRGETFSRSATTYYQLQSNQGGDSLLYRNQFQESPSHNRTLNAGLSLTQGFGQKMHLMLGYTLTYDTQHNDRNTFDLTAFGESLPWLELPAGYASAFVDSLSNRSHSRTLRHDIAVAFTCNKEPWNAYLSLTVRPERRTLRQKTGLMEGDTTRRSTGFEPVARLSWQREETAVELIYMGSTDQPDLSSLLNLTDNSNPLYITHGNPDLKPGYSQSVRLAFHSPKLGLHADASWRNELNTQTTAVIYDSQTGSRETFPTNLNGNWAANGSVHYNKRFGQFGLDLRTEGSYDERVGLLNDGSSRLPQRSATCTTGAYARIRLNYRPKWGNFDLSGDWNFRRSTNSLQGTAVYTRNYSFRARAHVDLPGNLRMITDAEYSFRNGTNIRPGEDDQAVWNAELSWRFLRKRQAELKLRWEDILSQRKNYTRSTTATGMYEYHTRQIGSYFLISLRYNFSRPLRKKD